jgi:polysaccharide biosynthesis protein PslH
MGEHLPFCDEVVGVPKPRTYGTWNLIRGAAGKWPLPVLNYTTAAMAAELAKLKGPYDLVHLDSIHMTRYSGVLAGMPGISKRIVYNWHNIESEAMLRHGRALVSKARRLYAEQTAHKLERLEREILGSAFGHLVCSERERALLLRIAPQARIVTVENGVDTAYFDGAARQEGPRRSIVFVGKMDYYPNIEAARHFVERVWPAVTVRLPGTTLTIAGSDPVEAVRGLERVPGVSVTGTVPDLRPFYRDALAAIVPLRTGGGTRLKILEAMAAGVPVISTRLGAEGLSVEPGRDILIADADAPEQWVAHLERLAEAPEEGAKISARGIELVKTRYDWDIIGGKLRQMYEEWLDGSE